MDRLTTLLHLLWETYVEQVPAARVFAELCEERGLPAVNDHIAFRTIHGSNYHGISSIARVWGELGYAKAEEYQFPSKKLRAIHMEPPDPVYPKIFISEYLGSHKEPEFNLLQGAKIANLSPQRLHDFFHVVPYFEPPREDVLGGNQYADWVRCFGNRPNHFTGSINALHEDIEAISELMELRGVKMTRAIQGEPGSPLRQTSSIAYDVDVPVLRSREDGNHYLTVIRRPYAYYELAERGTIRFEGFLDEQAANLFDVTTPSVQKGEASADAEDTAPSVEAGD